MSPIPGITIKTRPSKLCETHIFRQARQKIDFGGKKFGESFCGNFVGEIIWWKMFDGKFSGKCLAEIFG